MVYCEFTILCYNFIAERFFSFITMLHETSVKYKNINAQARASMRKGEE